MRIKNNLKIFNQSISSKIIYRLIIFVIAYMPITLVHAVYEDCEAVKAPYIEDNLCKIEVKNCKEDGVTMNVPDGSKLVAACDVFRYNICATVVPPPPNCYAPRCPIDPNQCANDNEGDGITNYTNTQIAFTVRENNEDEEQDEANVDDIHSCEKVGETTIQDHRCRIEVTGCKRGNLDAIPPGHTATAICNIQIGDCNRMEPPSCIAYCPTNANECANDDADNNNDNNYTNVEDVLGGFRYTPERLERRNRNRNRGTQQRGTGVN